MGVGEKSIRATWESLARAITSEVTSLAHSRTLRSFLGVLLVAGVGAVLAFLARVVIQRTLPQSEVGAFALLITLVTVIGPASLWGQATVILRTYAQAEPGTNDYVRDGVVTLAPSLALVGLLSVGAWFFYRYSAQAFAFVGVGSFLLAALLLVTMLMRSQRLYVLATALDRAPHALLILVAASIVLTQAGLRKVLVGQILLLLLSVVLGVSILRRWVKRGPRVLTAPQRREGGPFLLHQLSFLASFYGDIVIAGALIGPATLATYSVVLNLMGGFDLLRTSLQTILITESGRRSLRIVRRLAGVSLVLAMAVLGVYLLLGAPLLSLLFSGRYDEGKPLVLVLALAGFFQVAYSIGYSIIVGRAQSGFVRRFIWIDIMLSILGLALLWAGTAGWGSMGTAVALGLIWAVRSACAFLILMKAWSSPRVTDAVPSVASSSAAIPGPLDP